VAELNEYLERVLELVNKGEATLFDKEVLANLAEYWDEPSAQAAVLDWYSRLNVRDDVRRAVVKGIAKEKKAKTKSASTKSKPVDVSQNGVGNTDKAIEQLWSDTTNAVQFVHSHGSDIRYCYPWKAWVYWTGTHWQRDASGTVIRLAKRTVKDMVLQARKFDDPRPFLGHIKNSLSTASLKSMVENAQSEPGVSIQPDEFDSNYWLLNCANGTLDLRTGELSPHNRDDLITHCLSTSYDTNAKCPTWDAFLWRIMGGTVHADDSVPLSDEQQAANNRAQELINYLQEVIGYSLTGDTSEEALFILYGSGQNGKSKFIGALQDLLESYSQACHSKTFMQTDRSDGIPNDIARMRGARVVASSELGRGRRLNEELVKRATGRDPMTARFLNAEFFDFLPQFKLFMSANHLPKIDSVDKSMWRRIHQVPFVVTIPDDEKDLRLSDKLRAELPGILAWAVRGCLRWQKRGLKPAQAVLDATASYRADMDTVGRFIEERCLTGSNYRIRATTLYQAYKSWCDNASERAFNMKEFGQQLNDLGYQTHRDNGIWREGITTNQSWSTEPSSDDTQHGTEHGTDGTDGTENTAFSAQKFLREEPVKSVPSVPSVPLKGDSTRGAPPIDDDQDIDLDLLATPPSHARAASGKPVCEECRCMNVKVTSGIAHCLACNHKFKANN